MYFSYVLIIDDRSKTNIDLIRIHLICIRVIAITTQILLIHTISHETFLRNIPEMYTMLPLHSLVITIQ